MWNSQNQEPIQVRACIAQADQSVSRPIQKVLIQQTYAHFARVDHLDEARGHVTHRIVVRLLSGNAVRL